MKKIFFLSCAVFLLTASLGYGAWVVVRLNELDFGPIKIFNGNLKDGSIVVTGKISEQRSAIDIWPFDGRLPYRGAVAEQVWYRTRFKDQPDFERFSISAMNNDEAQYRLSVERGGSGEFRAVQVCFDGFGANRDQAYCPLRVTPDNGVQVCTVNNVCTRIGG